MLRFWSHSIGRRDVTQHRFCSHKHNPAKFFFKQVGTSARLLGQISGLNPLFTAVWVCPREH